MWDFAGPTLNEIVKWVGYLIVAAVIYALVKGGAEILKEGGKEFWLEVFPFLRKFVREKRDTTQIPPPWPGPTACRL